jgi:hypothetical protein
MVHKISSPFQENTNMTTNQHASNHPSPIGNGRHKNDIDDSAYESEGRSHFGDSPDDPGTSDPLDTRQRGRRPERSDENSSRYRR